MRRDRWFTSLGIAGKTNVLLAMAVALVLVIAIGSQSAGAAGDDVILTIQVGDEGSAPTAAGHLSCAEVSVGDVFPVNVWVENVSELKAYELRVTYDSSVLSLEDVDFDHFLLSTPPDGQIFPSLFEWETADSYFLAAAETRGSADSGSGALARLQMRAIGKGMGEIGIQTDPAVYGPRLTNSTGKPIGDDTGDRIFDGTVLSGVVAVNESCSDAVVENPPVSDGGDSGAGSDQNSGSDDPGSDSNSGGGADASGDGPANDSAGGGSQDGDSASSGGAGDGGAGSGADSEGGDDVAAASEDLNADDSGPGGPESAGSASEDGSGPGVLLYALIAVAAAAVLGGLGLVVKSLRAS